MEINKKVILLTGASGGLGQEMAKHLKAQSYRLALHYFQEPIQLKEDENLAHFQADLRNPDEIESMVKAVHKRFGSIDILINNAGISRSDVAWKASKEDWNETLAINLAAPFHLAKHCIPLMRENKWGRIVNISSIVAQTGFVGTSAYAASKAGLFGLSKTWSKELANSRISVNNIALGYFNTGMIHSVPEDIQAEIIQTIPLKRLGDCTELHKALDYILSEEAAYFTGQTLNLNGGMY